MDYGYIICWGVLLGKLSKVMGREFERPMGGAS